MTGNRKQTPALEERGGDQRDLLHGELVTQALSDPRQERDEGVAWGGLFPAAGPKLQRIRVEPGITVERGDVEDELRAGWK